MNIEASSQGKFENLVFPRIHSKVNQTEKGTLYLKSPGVVMLAAPIVDLRGMAEFLEGFEDKLGFTDYLSDPTNLNSAEQLVKTSGQVCYASFGPKRTMNIDAQKYINNLISSGHGSVLEHANFSLLFYGVSRSMSLEMVRHRAGMAYSQLSQRYVSGSVLRFVERPEYQDNPGLHDQFVNRIDAVAETYEKLSEELAHLQIEGYGILDAESRTDKRKRVQQTARSVLPNETETVFVATGNVRAWRHVISMRASEHAETEIRMAMFNAFLVLRQAAPMLFADYEVKDMPDGTKIVETQFPKV